MLLQITTAVAADADAARVADVDFSALLLLMDTKLVVQSRSEWSKGLTALRAGGQQTMLVENVN